MGTSDNLQVEAAPLMSDVQRWILDNMLGGMAGMMQGFNFGVPYGGANTASYTPLKFGFTNQVPSYTSPFPKSGEKRDEREDRRKEKKRERKRKAGPKTTTLQPPTMQPSMMAQVPPMSMVPFVLNNIPLNEAMPSSEELLTQQLTSPFALPFTQGLTGNYPKG